MFPIQFQATVTKSGQITIPAAIRKQLVLKPGRVVYQSIRNGKILLEFDLPRAAIEQSKNSEGKD